ncbi:helix-turn-helix domain-containing protein [Flavobacterium sp. MFBS3-15]|uniref:helix-turn-helix domain-containing protein n=1 Tax=Flavobacterium sp. MFBS3-15 TaxID=2989816 RepID=UPI002236A3C2|nr:helix-turn-helix transcriptional regulator [Flavobacterium sp. MFBS3-15]MCW4470525.1 helix-turn-helix domain-containing protein [Flavobacterium sp. MFBS3-15]
MPIVFSAGRDDTGSLQKGLTQEEEKAGTTKSYISKIENNVKEARLSTLQEIVEQGLGGHLELSIKI